ncbi:tail tape measure protein [uncultured Sphingomonas sp.]|uniref:tail tape measure protein n=1 Tax=uncultured Sphingomonas sp. TaxID=158754 RepID=UPI0025E0DAA4|nr:tail tape measure protein [uncultured Sphingomonas sp.]
MDEEIDSLIIGVRADTQAFARDVSAMRASLGDGLGGGADRAGRAIEGALARAVRGGKLGFDDLKAVALRSMEEIAGAALRSGIGASGGGGGLAGVAGTLLSAVLGLPGRATGGPVSPGAAYVVGERGPELFVPTSSGTVVPTQAGSSARDVRVSIAITAPGGSDSPRALARSSRQVAQAVARAIQNAEG